MRNLPSSESLVNEIMAIKQRYVEGWLVMLRNQCKVLDKKFRVAPKIHDTADEVSQKFLQENGVLDLDERWANKVVKESEAALCQQAGEREPADRYIRSLESLKKVVPLHSSLAICFLACHIAVLLVLPTDIVKWALDAELPYYSAFVEIDMQLDKPSWTFPLSSRTLFMPATAVGAWQLEKMAGSIAESIHMRLRPVSFWAIAGRYLKELSLTNEKIITTACRFCSWIRPTELLLSGDKHVLPTRVYVMAMLIITLRLLYDTLGQGVWEMSLPSSRSSSNNQDHDVVHLKKEKADQDLDLCTTKISGEETDTKSYLRSFSSATCSEFNTRELLYNLEAAYDKNNDKHGQGVWEMSLPSSSSSSNNQDCDVVHLKKEKADQDLDLCTTKISVEETDTKSYPRSFSSATDSEFNPRELLYNLEAAYDKNNDKHGFSNDYKTYLAYWKGVISAGISEHFDWQTLTKTLWDFYEKSLENYQVGKSEPVVLNKKRSREPLESDLDNAKATALRMLKADMEENGFIYMPPEAKKVAYYLQYKTIQGKFCYLAHADYYMLLRTCARLAEIDCRSMHLIVLAFEQWLPHLACRTGQTLSEQLLKMPHQNF